MCTINSSRSNFWVGGYFCLLWILSNFFPRKLWQCVHPLPVCDNAFSLTALPRLYTIKLLPIWQLKKCYLSFALICICLWERLGILPSTYKLSHMCLFFSEMPVNLYCSKRFGSYSLFIFRRVLYFKENSVLSLNVL